MGSEMCIRDRTYRLKVDNFAMGKKLGSCGLRYKKRSMKVCACLCVSLFVCLFHLTSVHPKVILDMIAIVDYGMLCMCVSVNVCGGE